MADITTATADITAAAAANITAAAANITTTAMTNITTAAANITTTAVTNITAAAAANITAAAANITTVVVDVVTTVANVVTATVADVVTATVADVTTAVVTDMASTVFTDIATAADITTAVDTTAVIATTTATTTDVPAASSWVVDPLVMAKTVAMLVLGLVSLVLGVAPLALLQRWRSGSFYPRAPGAHTHHQHPGEAASGSRAVSLLLCFGGGVLLCTTMLHLLPEVREAVAAQQRNGRLGDAELLADLLLCLGFFMVLAVDELAHSVLDRWCCGTRRGRRGASARRDASPCSAADQPSATVSLGSFREPGEPGRPGSPEDESTESQQQQRLQLQQRPQQPQQRDDGDDDAEKQQDASSDSVSLRGLFAVLALSFHEVFEGLALGLESRVVHVWYLFAAVATHKFVIAFYVGLDLAWSNTRRAVLVAYVATFAVVTPVGIACGMVITRFGVAGADGTPGPLAVVLQGLAAGTLIYVVFFEMLARHRQSGWTHLAATAIGFGTLYALQTLTHHHHHHGNGHDHVNNFGHDEGNFPYHDHHSTHEHVHSH